MMPNLLLSSNEYLTNQISYLDSKNIICKELTDGFATLKNGTLSNLKDPINNNDVATLNYLLSKKCNPYGPNQSIQYNENGEFKGSNNFVISDLLYVDEISNGIVSFSEGTFTGLSDPINSLQAANMNYVNNINNINSSIIINDNNINYSAGQMYNSIIYRDPIISNLYNTKFDTTASALSLINEFQNTTIGNSSVFYLKNISTNDDTYIYLKPGNGVTFNTGTSNGITVPRNYILSAYIIITSPTTVLIYINNISFGTQPENLKYSITGGPLLPYLYRSLVTDSLKISNLFITYYDDPILTNSPLNWIDIFYGQTTRKELSSDEILYLPQPASNFIFLTNISGYYRFIIRNNDTLYNVFLSATSGWILDPNSNFKIPPGKSLLLWFYINGSEGTITVYSIGLMSIT